MSRFSDENFLLEVAKGNVPGHFSINKFGHNPDVDTTTDPEDVWGGGGLYGFYPTTAQSIEVISDSTNDDGSPAGTGAQTVIIYGLDSNWDRQDETVTLDGTTAVAIPGTWLRIYRVVVLTAGTVGTNAGNLTVRISGGGTTAAYIMAGDGQTQQAIYTIPNGYTGFFIKGYVGMSDGGSSVSRESVKFKWKARPNNGVNGAWQTKGQIEVINDGTPYWQYRYGVPAGQLPEKTDIRIECVEVSADDIGVVGGFDLVMVDTDLINLAT